MVYRGIEEKLDRGRKFVIALPEDILKRNPGEGVKAKGGIPYSRRIPLRNAFPAS